MNKKTLISSLVMTAAVGISANASAVAVPGTLNDTWFETQVKQTLPKAINKVTFGTPSSWLTIKNKKIDSGKKTCYTHLVNADNTTPYHGEVYCKIANIWTHQSTMFSDQFGPGALSNMGDGNVGDEYVDIILPASGSSLNQPLPHVITFTGTLILKPKLNKSNVLTSVSTLTAKQGMVDYHEEVADNNGSAIEGQDKSNLKFTWVKNPDKIDTANDLRACAASYESNTDNVTGCVNPAPNN